MIKILLASKNRGKLIELRGLLRPLHAELVDPTGLGLSLSISEGEESYRQNAAAKALSYAQASNLWTIGDDSGLEVDALQGRPGVRSARLAGPGKSDADRRAVLLRLLEPHPQPWLARFRCALALASPEGELAYSDGICDGEIIPTERGSHGFGYDPIFLLAGLDRTMGELTRADKNRLSHRAKAVLGIIPVIREWMELGD